MFRLIRALVVVAATGALAVALAVAVLYALIVPRIDDFRPQLAGWASSALGVEVAMERLTAHRDGATLTLVAHGLTATDAAGQPGFVVSQAQLQLPLAALVHGRISALELQASELWLRRATDGTLWLAGKMLSADGSARPGAAVQWLMAQPGVAVHGGRVHWVDALLDREAVLTGLFAQLQRRGANHIVHVEAGQKKSSGPFLKLDAVLEPPADWALVGTRAHWRGHFALEAGAALTLDYEPRAAPAAASTRLQLSQVDLHTLAQLTPHLPPPNALQQTMDSLQPAGTLARLDARWQGPLRNASHWQASGHVQRLELAAQALALRERVNERSQSGAIAPERTTPSRPGVSGLDIGFATTLEGGHATLSINQRSLTFPGILEEPQVPVDRLQAHASWQRDADQLQSQVSQLDLANADAAGSFRGLWRTGNEAAGSSAL